MGVAGLFLERGIMLWSPSETQRGKGLAEGQDFLRIGRGAAHSNTQREENESIDSLLGYGENTEGKGAEVG